MNSALILTSIIASGACLIAGMMLLFFSVRGRLVLHAASCGRCGYHVAPESDENGTCAECGVSFATPNAVRYGVRKARKSLAVFGGVVLVFAVVVPIGLSLVRSVSQTLNTGLMVPPSPTWSMSADETPHKVEHSMWELKNIPTAELLDGLPLRPEDDGIWMAIGSRATSGELSEAEAIEALELATSLHRSHDLPRNGGIAHATRSIAAHAFEVLDPTAHNDLATIEAFVATAMPLDMHRIERANQRSTLDLRHFRLLPTSWSFTVKSVDATLDGAPLATQQIRTNFWRVAVPAIPSSSQQTPHTLELAATFEFTDSSDDASFQVNPSRTIPVGVLQPGDTATTYNETADGSLKTVFGTTTASTWRTKGDEPVHMLSLTFSPVLNARIAANLDVLPLVDGAVLVDGQSSSIAFYGNAGSKTFTSSPLKTYRLEAPLKGNTIDIDLEPSLERTPSRDAQIKGLIGRHIHLRGVPVHNLSADATRMLSTVDVSTSVVGGDEDLPVFGPSLLAEPSDESIAAMKAWFAPRLVAYVDAKGMHRVQFHYGSAGRPPFDANICVSMGTARTMIEPEAGGRTLDVVPTKDLPEPGAVVKVSVEGFSKCVRRDDRTAFFGGSFTLDVPLEAGTFNSSTGRVEAPNEKDAS